MKHFVPGVKMMIECLKPKIKNRVRPASSATCKPCKRKCVLAGLDVDKLKKKEIEELIMGQKKPTIKELSKTLTDLIEAHNNTTNALLDEIGLVRCIVMFSLLPLYKEFSSLAEEQIKERVNKIVEGISNLNKQLGLLPNVMPLLGFRNLLLAVGGIKEEEKDNATETKH